MYSINELLIGYEKKAFSPVEIAKYYLEKANKHKDLNAFIRITEEIALKQAEISEKRLAAGQAGLLEGIPLSYKDNIYVKGIPATSGSFVDRELVPLTDASIVHILQQQGAVMTGKTNMHEFAFGITNNNPFYDPARNPWNPDYISGGSSGGSAVSVAAGLSAGSIGTDTGGSVRIPASCCGLTGLKPTYGLLDTKGVTPISGSLDHTGPIARNVDDLSIMMQALTNKQYRSNAENLNGWRIGVPKTFFIEKIEPEVLHTYKEALKKLEDLGALLIEVDVPSVKEAGPLTFTIAIAEAGFVHKERIAGQLGEYGPDVKQVMETAPSITAIEYIEAMHRKKKITEACNQLLEDIDLLATPTLPALPQPIGQEELTFNAEAEPIFNCMIRYTSYFNLTGHPALNLPAGLSNEGLPIGIQFVSGKYKEKMLIKAGSVFERHYLGDFYKKRNSLCVERNLSAL